MGPNLALVKHRGVFLQPGCLKNNEHFESKAAELYLRSNHFANWSGQDAQRARFGEAVNQSNQSGYGAAAS